MTRQEAISVLSSTKRIVLKIGTSLLTDAQGVKKSMIEKLCREVQFLRNRKIEVIIVTSGAVGTARSVLRESGSEIAHKQALAAIGQGRLIAKYEEVFTAAGIITAQVLITARDLRDRRAYLNIGNTISALISMNVVPVINENDTVSTDELKFGDNDLLSAACSSLFGAELLVILTSAPGFLKNSARVPFLESVTEDDLSHALGPEGPGSGGMRTKLRAGQLCLISGQALAILPGDHNSPLQSLLSGDDIGTLICGAGKKRISARKKWLLYARPEGEITIDSGAMAALTNRGSSLLPAGIKKVTGSFLSGDPVDLVSPEGKIIGRGISNYSFRDLSHLSGKQLHGPAEVIHRDNLILE